jgi:hypothetical protein
MPNAACRIKRTIGKHFIAKCPDLERKTGVKNNKEKLRNCCKLRIREIGKSPHLNSPRRKEKIDR